MNEKIDIDVKTLRPFTRFIYTIGELPTSYLMSMTYEEQLIWLCNYLKETVIPTVNNNAEAVKEVQDIVMELQDYINNYFDNLDVQEEINNKLDDMAESGQLTDIIAQYLGLAGVLAFNTVSDMKEATNLVNGSICKTLGYHTLNDDGMATYKIRSVTNEDTVDEMLLIALYDENLVAELIQNDEINVKQLGAYGNDTNDDTTSLQTALDNFIKIIIPEGTYKISSSLYLNDNNYIKGINSVIDNHANNPALRCTLKNNITIEDIKIIDTNTSTRQTALYLYGDNYIIRNVEINGVGGDGIALGTGKNILVENCRIINSHLIPILAFQGDHVTFRNLYIKGAGHKYTCQFKSCVNSTMENILIEEGSEISCLSTRQALTENPDAIMPTNITIKNIKIIDHSKGWTPQDNNLVACLFEGNNYYVSDIQIIDSYTGAMKVELNDSIVENIIVDGYGLDGNNNVGIILTDATDYGKNNIIKNIHIKNGTYQGLRSNLTNSIIEGINIIDCGTSSQLQFASADINSIIDNVVLEAREVDCRGLGFTFGTKAASNSKYTNIKRIKAVGFTQYDISGSSIPDTLYIKCVDSVRFNAGRGNITAPFEFNKGKVTINGLVSTNGVTGVLGDVIIFTDTGKANIGYDRAYYDGTEWINIIPIGN